jgi:uroporphyrinogen-III synthase
MAKIYLLSNQKYDDVESIEIFKIKYISSNIDLSKYDALIFTSKNGIYSINSFNEKWKTLPSYAIARKTSEVVLKTGGIVEFIGNSNSGDDFAKELIPLLKDKKVLYIRAKKVVSNLTSILKSNGIQVDELITYETVCNDIDFEIEDDSTVIFTSPSSIKCFFKKFQWNETLKAVVIGETTSKFLPPNINFKISKETSIQECINLAKLVTF